MTYREICRRLRECDIPGDASIEAALLISHFCKIPRSEILLSPDKELDSPALSEAVEKRLTRYPLQYIIGEWGFCNEIYTVDENCLIPREETEVLVGLAAKLLPSNAKFADLCTGSGCVGISLASMREDVSGVLAELYPKTLELAKKNAARNGVSDRCGFVCGDVFDPALKSKIGQVDAIISNPPYIPSETVSHGLMRELSFEPRAALDGGEDGLEFYRCIIGGYGDVLRENGFMLFEIGYDEGESVAAIARENGCKCEIFKDYGGCDRVAYIKK